MKKLLLLCTLATFLVCAPLTPATGKDGNRDSLRSAWNELQASVGKQKVDEAKTQAAKPKGKVAEANKK